MAIKRRVIKTSRAQAIPDAAIDLSEAQVRAFSAAQGDPDWYAAARLAAFAVFDATPMPTLDDEPWRRTDIRAFDWRAVGPAALDGNQNGRRPVPGELRKPLVGDVHGGQVVISGGETIEAALLDDIRAQGVIFCDLKTAIREHADLLQAHLGSIVAPSAGKFAAFAATLADNGVFVYVPAGVEVAMPLHSVVYATHNVQASRVLVVAEDDSKLTYVHELSSPDTESGSPLHVGTVEVKVGKRAEVQFIETQSLSLKFWHFSHERTQVDESARLDWMFSSLGTHLMKSFTDLDLIGDHAEGRMSGFYFAESDQHLDHDTQQNHLALETTSDLLFKGALRDTSRSVWQGMIYVKEGAQQTDGFQANRNLVLSRKARADSIPGLEILADDVRCTHAATVGRLDQDEIFYLMSRGIDRVTAERVVVDGFYDPIMQRIPFEGVRERLKETIERKMEGVA